MSSKRWAVVAAGILIAGVVAADVLRGQFASYDSFEATTLAGDRWRLDDYRGQQPVLVVFGATWCQPCHMLAPTIEQLAETYGDRITVAKVDIDAAKALATQYAVNSIPTVLLFKDGEVAGRIAGVHPQQDYATAIDALLD